MDNQKKCDKYEAFFIFKDEEAFFEHLKNCPDCQKEHEKFMKVSKLVKEAAPVYLKKRTPKNNIAKRIACCFILFIGITAFTGYQAYDNYSFQINSVEDSYISTMMGLPVDEYGFLEI